MTHPTSPALPLAGTLAARRAAPASVAASAPADRPRPGITLAPGEARTLDSAEGTHLFVLAGRLWVTRSGDGEDHFPAAGQRLALGRGRVVVEAVAGQARFTLEP